MRFSLEQLIWLTGFVASVVVVFPVSDGTLDNIVLLVFFGWILIFIAAVVGRVLAGSAIGGTAGALYGGMWSLVSAFVVLVVWPNLPLSRSHEEAAFPILLFIALVGGAYGGLRARAYLTTDADDAVEEGGRD